MLGGSLADYDAATPTGSCVDVSLVLAGGVFAEHSLASKKFSTRASTSTSVLDS
jgi:hypothetical protein